MNSSTKYLQEFRLTCVTSIPELKRRFQESEQPVAGCIGQRRKRNSWPTILHGILVPPHSSFRTNNEEDAKAIYFLADYEKESAVG